MAHSIIFCDNVQTYVPIEELHVVHAIALDDQPEHLPSGSGFFACDHKVHGSAWDGKYVTHADS